MSWEDASSDFQRKKDGEIDLDIVERPVASTYIDNAWHYDRDVSPNGGRRDLLVDKSARLIPTESIKAPVLIIVGSKDPYVSPDLCDEAYRTQTSHI